MSKLRRDNKVKTNTPDEFLKSLYGGFQSIQLGIVFVNPENGEILHANPHSLKIFGIAEDRLVGSSLFNYAVDVKSKEMEDAFSDLMRTDIKSLSKDFLIKRVDEITVWLHISASIIPASENNQMIVCVLQDITRKKNMEKALVEIHSRNDKLSNAIRQVDDIVFITDPEGKIEFVNRSFELISGYTSFEVIGKTPSFFTPEQTVYDFSLMWKTMQSGDVWHKIITNKKKDGGIFYYDQTISPLLNEKSEIVNFISTGKDITERKNAEQSSIESEKRLKEAQRIAKTGNWELDHESGMLYWSDEIYRIFGITRRELNPSYKGFLEFIHPDDREVVNNAFINHLTKLFPYDIIHRLLLKDGTLKYVKEKCETNFSKNGKAIRSVGTVQDVTNEKRAEEEFIKLSERLSLASSTAQIGIWDWDIKNDILIWDEQMYSLYDMEKRKFTYKMEAWESRLYVDDKEIAIKEIKKVINGEGDFDLVFRIVRPDGSLRFIKGAADVYHNNDNVPVRMVGVNWDITDSKNIEAVNQFILSLSEKASQLSSEELTQLVLDEAVTISNSDAGFLHFVSGDQQNFTDQNWASKTIDKCQQKEMSHSSIDKAGSWAESLRLKRSLIFNDYKKLEKFLKNNLHVEVKRFMTVPIKDAKTIVAIIGVGNKVVDYNSFDLEMLELLAKNSWNIIKRKQIEEEIRIINEELETRVQRRTSELKESEQKFRGMTSAASNAIIMIDNAAKITFWNKAAERIFGWSENEAFNKIAFELLVPKRFFKDYRKAFPFFSRTGRGKTVGKTVELTSKRKNGEEFPAEVSLSSVNLDGQWNAIGIINDITDRKKSENERMKLSQAVEHSPASVVITDVKGNIDYVNPRFSEVTGYSFSEVAGQNPRILKSNKMEPEIYEDLWRTISKGKTWKGEFLNKKKNGELYWESASVSSMFNKKKEIVNYIGVKEDITERKRAEHILTERAARLDHHSKVLLNLTQGEDLTKSNIKNAFKLITEAAVTGLSISRSSVWLFENENKEALYCLNLYEADSGEHSSEITLSISDYPDFFETLHKEGAILCDNAEEQYTKDYSKHYLQPLKIVSMLDVPIWLRGKVIGVFCNEQSVLPRHWEPDEELFARSLSNFISLAIESDERKYAQNAAETATKAKSNFLANMSHEIRTPMNAIIGLTHLLQRTGMSRKQEDYAVKIDNAAKGLLGIINDILDFSKIEAGKMSIENVHFDLNSVLNNLSNMMGVKIQRKGLELVFIIKPEVPTDLIGDPLRIGQILLNLTSNAIKFTAKGEIRVVCEVDSINKPEKKVTLKLSVIDSGIGLTEQQQSLLFTPFSQADTSTTRKFGGTGLGLSISRKLSELMNGDIGVSSVFGEGSSFYFTFECGIAGVDKSLKNSLLPKNMKNMRVLVVDNNESSREILETYLRDFSFNITSVSNGREAVSEFLMANGSSGNPYGLILMDYKMPDLNGIDTFREFQKLKSLKQPKVILTTGYAREEIMKEASDVGLDAFLLKPVGSSILFDTILQVFGHSQKSNIKSRIGSSRIKQSYDGIQLLLVEDNEVNQQVAKELLESDGFEITIANHGKEAVNILTENPDTFGAVLMDLQMPEMDGYEASGYIRTTLGMKDLPIIAMTADAMSGVQEAVLSSGMNDYVSKPIVLEDLFRVLNKWLRLDVTVKKENVEIAFEIPGLNIKEGLERVGNNQDAYFRVLQKFVDNYSSFSANLKKELEAENFPQADILVHTLKGVSGNIGADQIFHKVKHLNKRFKNGNYNAYKHLISEIQQDLESLFSAIEKNKKEVVVENKKEISSLSLDEVIKQLTKLKEYVLGNDFESIQQFDQIHDNLMQYTDSARLNKIKQFLSHYKFEKAMIFIDELLLAFENEDALNG